MLKYLMKYDIKKMTKLLIYLYPITIALAGITRLINIGKDIQILTIIGSVFASLTYTLIANILINAIIAIIATFTTNFYKDQSYLTHTLPVKKEKLLLSMYFGDSTTILRRHLVLLNQTHANHSGVVVYRLFHYLYSTAPTL